MLSSCFYGLPYPLNTGTVRMRALEEPTIAADNVVHTVLRHLVESYVLTLALKKQNLQVSCQPSEAKTIGLSCREGSVRQNTSAKPSDDSCACGLFISVAGLDLLALIT